MNIEVKLKPGQSVYVLWENAVEQGELNEICIRITGDEVVSTHYDVRLFRTNEEVRCSLAGISKAELLAQL